MTIGALKRQTSNFLFNIVNFDFGRWHSYEHENWDNVDAILAAFITGTGLKGLWRNSTIYATSDRVIDPDTSDIYLCLQPHTSAATPTTFSADRVANPTYWRTVAYEPQHRGQWLTATVYGEADFVSDAGRYGYVTVDYLSGASYNADVAGGKIVTLIDLSSDAAMISLDCRLDTLEGTTIPGLVTADATEVTNRTNADNLRVLKAGDTMTGDLMLSKNTPFLRFHDTAGAANVRQYACYVDTNSWGIAAYNDLSVWQRTLLMIPHAGGLVPSHWTTGARPASPTAGQIGYNTTQGWLEVFISGTWWPFGDTTDLVGTYVFGAFDSTPYKHIKANGAAVLIATYPELAAKIYCGDVNNATATWGYKATTNVSPSTNRSTAGTYIVVPDMRGEFLRGLDDGRGVDSGRGLWLSQAEMIGPHNHGFTDTYSSASSQSNSLPNSGQTHNGAYNFSATGGGAADTTSNNSGTENRPRNLAAVAYIRYAN